MKANASKHKAMSYGRMVEDEQRLEQEIRALLDDARKTDRAEDEKFGKGKRGDELPAELARRETRLQKIQEAKAALEQQARERAEREAEEARAKNAEREKRRAAGKRVGQPSREPDPEQAKPEAKAQRNFTDPESRIMLDGATKGFVQAYNAQVAVDDVCQIIVATGVTQQATDNAQLVPLVLRVQGNLGALPQRVSADAGYYSDANVTSPHLAGIDLFIPPNQHERSEAKPGGYGRPRSEVAEKMREKLRSAAGQAVYSRRKVIAEPVFGQTKEARGIRGFLLRGIEKVRAEWDLICLGHNLLKLHRFGVRA